MLWLPSGLVEKAWAQAPALAMPVNPYVNASQAKLIALIGCTAVLIQSTFFAYRHQSKVKLTPFAKYVEGKLVLLMSNKKEEEKDSGDNSNGDDEDANQDADAAASVLKIRTDLRDDVTVLVTTSPLDMHPSTALIEHTMDSTRRYVKGLIGCRTIVICDGCTVADTNRFRRGEVTEDGERKYNTYIESLKRLSKQEGSPLFGAEVLVLTERCGFGMALAKGIARVTTEFVMVLQHDRDFRRPLALPRVVRSMRHFHDKLKSVSFPTSTTDPGKYIAKIQTAHNINLAPLILHDDANGSTFVPLVQWYDSAHIASTAHYRDFVFSDTVQRVSPGGFIEDRLGQLELQHIKDDGIEIHCLYGNYVLNDGVSLTPVRHLDGHDQRLPSKLAASRSPSTPKKRENFVYGC